MSKSLKILLFSALIVGALYLYKNYQKQKAGPVNPASVTISPSIPLKSFTTPISTQSFEEPNAKCHVRFLDSGDLQAVLPDQACTPGVTNPSVTQDNLSDTICKSGFTATIRPPASYTNKLKVQQIAEYGFVDTNLKDYEEDHFISLELGGSPDSPQNLWPEPHGSPNEKDKVENYLHKQICDGAISLQEAQREVMTNWYTIYKTLH